jgi:hypothetical protein
MRLAGITAGLFCGLYALFWVVAVSTPHPAIKSAPEAQETNWRTWT